AAPRRTAGLRRRTGAATVTPAPQPLEFVVAPSRCIGCQACVQACTECDTHRGESMIHLEYVDRAHSVQTVPVVCMHCEQPTCAEVCPGDSLHVGAIKRTADGPPRKLVQSARKPPPRTRKIGRAHV